MVERNYDAVLVIEDEYESAISVNEAEALKSIQKRFMESYLENKDKKSIPEWLNEEMQNSLPEYSGEEISKISDEIITTLKIQEDKKKSLEKSIESGRSKDTWFVGEVKKATSHMSTQESVRYLQSLDSALASANESLYNTLYTKAGTINMNPHLDGFIAEQWHAQTFNLNAEAAGSSYRAKVLEPSGNGYTKNSVDIEIIDGNGKVVKRYQSKYCKNAENTAQAFENGDYRGQQKLVPEGQEIDIAKKTTTVIESPDGVTSQALPKSRAKELQKEAQSGKWNELNWNEYQMKDVAVGIGKQAGQSAVLGAAIGVGFDVAQKAWNGERINGEDVVKTAISTGTDFGVKAAAAGALKVGVEKGFVKVIPKGTPAGTIANIVHVGIENAKVIGKMVDGEYTFKEGLDKMEQNTVATMAGIATGAKGAAIGAAVGMVFGPIGAAMGGCIGGTVGYMAGSKVGKAVVQGAQKIRKKTRDFIRSAREKGRLVKSTIKEAVREFFSW